MIFKDLKAKIIFLFSVITYLIAGLSALICNRITPNGYGLLVGLIFTTIAFLFHLLAKKKAPLLFIVSCFMNAIAAGFSIGSYFSYTKIFLPVMTVVFLLHTVSYTHLSKLPSDL